MNPMTRAALAVRPELLGVGSPVALEIVPDMPALVRHGSVTADVPASLPQRHPDARVTVTVEVTQMPEPELR